MSITFLYGAPASGKTTLGRKLSSYLNCDFIDLDERIVEVEEHTISEIFELHNEEYFRKVEDRELRKIIAEVNKKETTIIALGGGTLLNEKLRKFVEKNGNVVCIKAPNVKELKRRLALEPGLRPLGNMAKKREEHYASFMASIVNVYEEESSLIVIGDDYAKKLISNIPTIADKNFSKNHKTNSILILPSGEKYKTLSTIQKIWKALSKNGICRKDIVASIGGGVTSDLVGFAASTWMRGIDWIAVPTTPLAMIDAAIGGKTGFDLPEGKNLIGSFYPPKLVLIDIDLMWSCEIDVIISARGEILKCFLIDGELIFGGHGLDPRWIAQFVESKLKIVREDPLEKTGKRMILNCGHTIGHALEKYFNYSMQHGYCVGIGCLVEALIARKLGLTNDVFVDNVIKLFKGFGLKVKLPKKFSFTELVPLMLTDKKKKENSTITFALPCAFGDVRLVPINVSNFDFSFLDSAIANFTNKQKH